MLRDTTHGPSKKFLSRVSQESGCVEATQQIETLILVLSFDGLHFDHDKIGSKDKKSEATANHKFNFIVLRDGTGSRLQIII